MSEEQKRGWKKLRTTLATLAATIGLGIGSGAHANSNTENKSNIKIESQIEEKNKAEKTFILEIHKSFQNTKFYENVERYGFESLTSDFEYVFNTILKDNLSENEISNCVKSLKKIILESKKLNAKYKELLNKNLDSNETSLYFENIKFYQQLPFEDYITAIQNLLKKKKNYSKFGDGPQYIILNLHAFVGISKNL